MRLFILLACFCAVLLGAGCVTSHVVEHSRTPEIIIDQFGDITFHGERIRPDQVASAVAAAKLPKSEKVKILVPEERDHVLMRAVTDNLHRAGYRPVFVTNQKAAVNLKQP